IYGNHVLLQYFETNNSEGQTETIPFLVAQTFGMLEDQIHLKIRRRRVGIQHEKLAATGAEFAVEEGPHKFLVNLDDYIDTGLFLDHRNLRREVGKVVQEFPKKRPDVLNLFS